MQKVPLLGLYSVYAIASLASTTAILAQGSPERPPLVHVELLAEKAAVRPGDTITVALRQTIKPGWHTYWSNPGDSGEPTRIDWKLPAGASASPISWPLPFAIPIGPLMNYGYSVEILLLSDITLPKDASGNSVDIAADVKWLVCEEICVPEEASVRLALPLIEGPLSPRPSSHAGVIAAARKSVPSAAPWPATFQAGKDDVVLKIEGMATAFSSASDIRFFPSEWGRINHAAPQTVAFRDGRLLMRFAPGDLTASPLPGGRLEGLLAIENRVGGRTERQGYSISAAAAPASELLAEFAPLAAQAEDGISLGLAIVFAFLGGVILNFMPCVFPVLSLKALSLARDAGDAGARRVKGTVYLAGVLASFFAIGVAVLAMRMGGVAVGWGMQFQSPAFVLFMISLFLMLALNMSGVFTVGSRIAGAGDGLTRRAGLSGYFFTGMLATLVATPCTAPFMGAAIGYAFVQPAAYIFAVLLALGLGFALPIVLLSITPALGHWLPKPGAWMETFKQLMAFPLYATVAWLVWVLSVQQGSDGVLAASLTLLGTGFAAWLLGRGGEMRIAVTAAALAIGAIVLGIASLPPATAALPSTAGAQGAGPVSESFTAARLAELLSQNRPVFVNLTAAWCITCKVNERVALRSERITDAFAAQGVTYLVGDWTNGNPEITALLKAHGRVGVPLYLLYAGSGDAKPTILPQLLTESIVLDRIAGLASPQKAAKGDI